MPQGCEGGLQLSPLILCYVQTSACNMQCLSFDIQPSTFSIHPSTCNFQHSTFSIWFSACDMQHANFNIKTSTCRSQLEERSMKVACWKTKYKCWRLKIEVRSLHTAEYHKLILTQIPFHMIVFFSFGVFWNSATYKNSLVSCLARAWNSFPL